MGRYQHTRLTLCSRCRTEHLFFGGSDFVEAGTGLDHPGFDACAVDALFDVAYHLFRQALDGSILDPGTTEFVFMPSSGADYMHSALFGNVAQSARIAPIVTWRHLDNCLSPCLVKEVQFPNRCILAVHQEILVRHYFRWQGQYVFMWISNTQFFRRNIAAHRSNATHSFLLTCLSDRPSTIDWQHDTSNEPRIIRDEIRDGGSHILRCPNCTSQRLKQRQAREDVRIALSATAHGGLDQTGRDDVNP